MGGGSAALENGSTARWLAPESAWEQSAERARVRSRRRMLLAVGGFLAAMAFLTYSQVWNNVKGEYNTDLAAAAGVLALVGLGACVAGWFQFQEAHADFLQQAQRQRVDAAIEQLQNSMELADLFRLNQRQIDAYHDLTKAQAAHSYRNSQLAMGIGFLVLVAGSVVAIMTRDDTAKIVVGALASMGAAISGYVGATFMRAHNESLAQLNFYFRQPLVNSYLLTAERLAAKVQDSPEVFQRTYSLMIEHVMSNAFMAPQGRSNDTRLQPVAQPQPSAPVPDVPVAG